MGDDHVWYDDVAAGCSGVTARACGVIRVLVLLPGLLLRCAALPVDVITVAEYVDVAVGGVGYIPVADVAVTGAMRVSGVYGVRMADGVAGVGDGVMYVLL